MACEDVNAILVGYRGRIDMLKACFSSPDKPPEPPSPPEPKATTFGKKMRAFAKDNNARIDKRKGKK